MEYPFYLNGKFWQVCKVSDSTNIVESVFGLYFRRQRWGDWLRTYAEAFTCNHDDYVVSRTKGGVVFIDFKPKQGKDDMSKIKLMAGKGEPQADKRVNVWIENDCGQKESASSVGPIPYDKPRIIANELRIMSQVDGGEPRCIGEIKPRRDSDIGSLIVDFANSYIHSPAGLGPASVEILV